MTSPANASSKPRSRLGRGLNALISLPAEPVYHEIPNATAQAGQDARIQPEIELRSGRDEAAGARSAPLDAISLNPHQPRKQMDETRLAELAASIKSTGLIQPIVVRPLEGGYQLIAGERRLRAARLAGLVEIPVILRHVGSIEQAQMALVENTQREDLNPIDRAQGYRTLLSQLGLTQAELAERVGEDRSSIANYLRLLDLAEPVQQYMRDGRLSLGHAKVLAGVEDPAEQKHLADLVVNQDLSVRNLERILQGQATPAPQRSAPSAHLADLEKNLSRQLGMRVQVRSGRGGKGRMVIHYASLDQFDDLMGRLGIKSEEM